MDRYRLLILGAGFSASAGFPLADRLWAQVRAQAANYGKDHRASKFFDDLGDYIKFKASTGRKAIDEGSVDFEDFMKFLDIEHWLSLRGSDTWSEEGNEGTVVAKHFIGKLLLNHADEMEQIPDLYKKFATKLNHNDMVITFNYDNLLERSLDAVGKPYRLFPDRISEIHENHNVLDTDHEEVVILKMHGSVDWFSKDSFDFRNEMRRRGGGRPVTDDVIFSNSTALGLEKVCEGLRPKNDPISNLFRVKNTKLLHSTDILFRATPRIMSPSAAKLVYFRQLSDFWRGMSNAGSLNFGMSIIGFSMPTHDEYLLPIIYRIAQNYQNCHWRDCPPFPDKTPLVLVDLFRDQQAEDNYRERYKFVDWEKAVLKGDGFDEEALSLIFAD